METSLSEEARDELLKLMLHLQNNKEKLEQFIRLSDQLLWILENNLSYTVEKLKLIAQNGGKNEQQNTSDVRSVSGS